MLGIEKIKKLLARARKANDAIVHHTETGLSKAVQLFARQRIKSQGGIQNANDWLLAGRPDKFAEAAYGFAFNKDGSINHDAAPYPWMGQEVPEDLRQPNFWDGRLPDGEFMYRTGFSHITEEDGKAMEVGAAKTGLRFAQLAAATTFLTGLKSSATSPGMPVPTMGEWIYDLPPSAMANAIASGVLVYGVDAIGKLLELVTSNVWPITACATLSAIVFAFSLPAGTAIALNKALGPYKRSLTEKLTVPTQDALYHWWHETEKRSRLMVVYANAVRQALGWRKHLPVIKIGVATGITRWRGLSTAPVAGQDVCLDGISMRQNIAVFGGTGTGKTRDFMKPFAKSYLEADWSEKDIDGIVIRDHKAGMLVMDGKGKLGFDLVDIIPKHRLADVRLIATEDGAWVMDITSGMTIEEIVEFYILLAKQKAGSVENEQWINGSGDAFGHAGYFGKLLETKTIQVSGKNIWANRSYSPSSLMGMVAITVEMSLNQAIAAWVMAEIDKGKHFHVHVVDAARYFSGYWKELATETRSSFVSNVNNTFGDLTQNKRLADRFASGPTLDYPTARIEEIFEGKIFLIGISEIVDGSAGSLVANFIKQKAYLLAQQRLAESAKADELLKRVEDCRVNYDDLMKRATPLKELELLLQDVEFPDKTTDVEAITQQAVTLFKNLFPEETRFNLFNMRAVQRRDLDGVESKIASFTDDVQLMAFDSDEGARMVAHYQTVVDAPKTASCCVMIDEYQDYVTRGKGGKADTTFTNKCRETGMFLVVASQTVHAITKEIGHVEMMNLMSNFTTKVFFKTDNSETHKFCIGIAGDVFQSRPYSSNLFSNFSQALKSIHSDWIAPPAIRLGSVLWPSLKTDIDDRDVFWCKIQDVDIGTKADLTSNLRRDNQNVNEWRNRKIAKEDAEKAEMKEGSIQPLVTVDDLERLEEGHAFVIWNRAGMTRKDFVYLR